MGTTIERRAARCNAPVSRGTPGSRYGAPPGFEWRTEDDRRDLDRRRTAAGPVVAGRLGRARAAGDGPALDRRRRGNGRAHALRRGRRPLVPRLAGTAASCRWIWRRAALGWLGGAAPVIVWGAWGFGALVLAAFAIGLTLLVVLLRRDTPTPRAPV
ncbi:MAG: hypothetical protein MZW92_22980 [Comamonadaceae bacterium]|nr:hypothetical protein [Comamonadaceae bacterium]